MLSYRQGGDLTDTVNDRIAQLVKATGLSKTAFAQKINVSPSFVSLLCAGNSAPSDRTISDICREFGVNEIWLRTGGGEMFRPSSRSDDIAAFMGDILKAGDEDFRNRFISALSRLSVEGWAAIEQVLAQLAEDSKKRPSNKL